MTTLRDCPCCFGNMVDNVCRSCRVAIGTAVPFTKDVQVDRTIADPAAECVGRRMRPAATDPFDDGPVWDERDNNRTPGLTVSHFYTVEPRRSGWLSPVIKEGLAK